MSIEGKTHFERVIGGTQEDRDKALQELQEMFENKSEVLMKHELEKTEEDIDIINRTASIVDEIVSEYGGEPKAIPIDKIHILKPNSVYEMTGGKLASGIHKALSQNIGVEKRESNLLFSGSIAHELFHSKSYKSARIDNPSEGARLYRFGISMTGKRNADTEAEEERWYFSVLEEAIVSECTNKFFDRVRPDSLFADEIKASDMIRAWITDFYRKSGMPEERIKLISDELKSVPGAQEIVERTLSYSEREEQRSAFAAGIIGRLVEDKKIEGLGRYEERTKLYKLLDEIIEKSGGEFKEREEIFAEFAKANFSGKYFKIARIIEGVLGEGSFRRLAEEFSTKPKRV
ncbi:MAG: hypothetical protein ABSF47_00840 [Minisyncoccia bacterium]|jgi:hypothetical protein